MSGDRLTGQDATFLYTETDRTPFLIATCLVLDTRGWDPGQDAEVLTGLRAQLSARLDRAPRLRQRIQRVPGNLHHPVWVDDERFDIEYHVQATRLPEPGSEEQLTELLGRLLAEPLDPTRPLWEMRLVHGLERERSAIFLKTHHAAVDGLSGFQVLTTLVDLEESPEDDETAVQEWRPARAPGAPKLLLDAGLDLAKRPFDIPRNAARSGWTCSARCAPRPPRPTYWAHRWRLPAPSTCGSPTGACCA